VWWLPKVHDYILTQRLPRGPSLNRPGDSGHSLVWVCYWKGPVSPISRAYRGVTGGFVAQSKSQNALFSIHLRWVEYGSSNQGVRGSNPFGRTFYQSIKVSKVRSVGLYRR
jgi:hypothetical protein